ncbi:hypothetical protein MRBLWH7_000541 [Microbacterium sp. LWH7-1.2]|uniref:hypothetical protein n=1 Tax=Microbacterium sp. LWH7-1.2 TaxID=3135257 RepID=UPI0031398C12
MVDRLLTRGLVMGARSADDRHKKIVRLVDNTMNPDDVDPLSTAPHAIAARLTLSDAQIVAASCNKSWSPTTHPDEMVSAPMLA